MTGTPRYKRLEIEWKHFEVNGVTCERCGDTGEGLRSAVEELRREFAPVGVKIHLTETILDKARIAESNEIWMNGHGLRTCSLQLLYRPTVLPAGPLRAKAPAAGQLRSVKRTMRIFRRR